MNDHDLLHLSFITKKNYNINIREEKNFLLEDNTSVYPRWIARPTFKVRHRFLGGTTIRGVEKIRPR